MKDRVSLNEKLVDILGSRNVYFQPPENLRMSYPAIVYERSGIPSEQADNIDYLYWHRYQVTLIDSDPDSRFVDLISQIPNTRYVRHFSTEGLNHDVFEVVW